MAALVTYRVRLAWDEEGRAWNVEVPALPGCVTYGETQDEALSNAREAIAGFLEVLRRHGEPIPPSDAEEAVTVAVPGA